MGFFAKYLFQRLVNARLFCTRWNGLEKGSIFDDALDDKEYAGNLIYLLQSGLDFVKNNSKIRFQKQAQYRVDKPDYSERAVTEALVNALIHRDYLILGSEIHINMYDDRLEISSPGGMYAGKVIQDINIHEIESVRRNPIIADLFHRMKFMERRGSGLGKIIAESAKLPDYTTELAPYFYSTSTSFIVVIKGVNYAYRQATGQDSGQDRIHDSGQDKILKLHNKTQDNTHDRIHDNTHDRIHDKNLIKLLEYCSEPRTRDEMQAFLKLTNRSYFSKKYLKPLLEEGNLEMTLPDTPRSKFQKYLTSIKLQ